MFSCKHLTNIGDLALDTDVGKHALFPNLIKLLRMLRDGGNVEEES
jgi:hypothetical protein